VYYNATASSLTDFGATLAAGDLALDDYLGGDTAWGWPTVRWTAPAAGIIDIAATWINPGDTVQNAYIAFNAITASDPVASTTLGPADATGVSYSQTGLSVEAGDTVDFFAAGTGGLTILDATITMMIPEPATMVLLGLGGLAAVVRRKRR